MSGEIAADVADAYRESRQTIENAVNARLERHHNRTGLDRWRYVAIIREEDHPAFEEVAQLLPKERGVEFRLKVDHGTFSSGSPTQRTSLLFESLLRSVSMMRDVGLSENDVTRLEEAMTALGREKGWSPK